MGSRFFRNFRGSERRPCFPKRALPVAPSEVPERNSEKRTLNMIPSQTQPEPDREENDNPVNRCPQCGTDQFQGFVQYGSYVIRCAGCGLVFACTSYCALGKNDESFCRVFQSSQEPPFPWNRDKERLLVEGLGKDIYAKVCEVAEKGTWLRIEWLQNERPNGMA